MSLTPQQIGRIVHEANRALQIEQADPTIPVSPAWDAETDELRASCIEGVEGVIAGNNPEQSHQAWIETRVRDGWRFGDVKDAAAKTHPLLIPYNELPESQKLKDALCAAIVLTLA